MDTNSALSLVSLPSKGRLSCASWAFLGNSNRRTGFSESSISFENMDLEIISRSMVVC